MTSWRASLDGLKDVVSRAGLSLLDEPELPSLLDEEDDEEELEPSFICPKLQPATNNAPSVSRIQLELNRNDMIVSLTFVVLIFRIPQAASNRAAGTNKAALNPKLDISISKPLSVENSFHLFRQRLRSPSRHFPTGSLRTPGLVKSSINPVAR